MKKVTIVTEEKKKKKMSSDWTLGRQGIAFRGHGDENNAETILRFWPSSAVKMICVWLVFILFMLGNIGKVVCKTDRKVGSCQSGTKTHSKGM